MNRILLIAALLIALVFTASADRRREMMARNASASTSIAYRSHETNIWSANNFTISKPAGTATGDILVFLICTDTAAAWTNSTAWTLQETNANAGAGFLSYTRVVDGSEGASFTVNFDAVESGGAILLAYSGASALDTDGVETGAPGAGTPHVTAAITPSVNNCMLIGCIYIDPTGDPTYTEVSGFPLKGYVLRSSSGTIAVAEKLQTTATSEGVQITENVGGTWGEYTLSLKP
jgi:hypothetical protein